MIELELSTVAEIKQMQATVIESHYLHRPVDSRCSVEAYRVILSTETPSFIYKKPIGLLMFGRPEATRCGSWYGSVADVQAGKCEVTRWQVLNLARVWLSPEVQPGGHLHNSGRSASSAEPLLPGYTDRRGAWRSTLASTAIKLAAQQIGHDYLLRRPPCFLDEPYQINYLMSYCDRKVHRGVIYQAAGFELYRTNSNQIETWRLRLDALTAEQDNAVRCASNLSERSRAYRNQRQAAQAQMALAF
jgi:hypothetical protein